MAVEEDMLKTLQRIQNLLERSSQTTGSSAGGRTASRQTPQQQRDGRQASGDKKTFQATTKAVDDLGDAADSTARRFRKLERTIFATQAGFVNLNKSMRVYGGRPSGSFNSAGAKATESKKPTEPGMPGAQGFGGTTKLGKKLSDLTGGFSLAKTGLIDFVANLSSIAKPLVDDWFKLRARGIDAGNALGTLYYDAARAGISLADYTAVLDSASPAVLRAGSFKEFGETLNKSNNQLAGLGIFGEQAVKLSATLANSATVLGVPQAQLADSMSKQNNVFEELRKTSMITADQFAELNKGLADNQEVQGQLLGMEPQQRAAALQELTRTRALGVSMGMSADASKKLGDALIEQRKLTAVQRFQAAGTLRQAGAFLGMGGGDTDELGRLGQKKNRTTEEQARFLELAGNMESKIEGLQNSGNVQSQFMADQLSERLRGTGISGQLDAARDAKLAKDSGAVSNVDIGKATKQSEVWLGKIFQTLNGVGKNPIAMGVVSALGSAAFTVALGGAMKGGLGPLTNGIMRMAGMDKIAGLGSSFQGPMMPLGMRMQRGMGKIGGKFGRVGSAVMNGASVVGDALKSAMPFFGELGSMLGPIFKTGFKFLGAFMKRIPILGFFIDTISELFTGDVAAAFGPDANWVERIGNAIFAGITGLVGGIFSIVDSIGELFGLPENFFRNKFDIFSAWVRAGFFGLLENLAKMFTLGADNPVSTYFAKSKDAAFKVVDELASDSTATIGTVGEKNKKALDGQKKAADDATKATTAAIGNTDKIISSTAGLAQVAAGVVSSSSGIAMPGVTNQSSVTSPEVNSDTAKAAADAAAKANNAVGGTPVLTPTEALAVKVDKMIELLTNMLTAEQSQVTALQTLQGARAKFGDVDRMTEQIVRYGV